MLNHEIQNLKLVAKSWNNLDVSFIETILFDDFTYESQWVLKPIIGKESFLNYLNLKFQAIKEAKKSELISITAELTLHPSLKNKPGLVITQITERCVRQVSLLIKMHENKICCMKVCFIPDPTEAILIEEYPI
jgi:hypothetical protein